MSDGPDPGEEGRTVPVGEDMLLHVAIAVGCLLIGLAAVFNAYLLARFSPDGALMRVTVTHIHWAQVRFLVTGVSIIAVALALKRCGVFLALSRHQRITNAVVMIGSLGLFVFVANNILGVRYRPEPLTTVFVRDDKLGWRLKPNGDDMYGQVRYRINPRGLRSPHSDYRKPAATRRILQLGDSVTNGYGLPYEATSANILENMFRARRGAYAVEVINAGCDGYSPWQEYEFLQAEGWKYDPDLVTVGFVLNDVTEKFGLTRFGGRTVGGQLAHTEQYAAISRSRLYRALARTPIYLFLRERFLKVRLGSDIREGARRMEELQVQDLVFDHDNEMVEQAWRTTLANVERIGTYCADNGMDLLLLIYPFTFQFDLPDSMAHPQMRLKRFCEAEGIHYIDLLPVFRDRMRASSNDARYYFKDHYHPSAEGNRVAAEAALEFIVASDLLGPSE